MAKEIYIVVKQGVYVQEVSGPFDRAEAERVAQEDAGEDRDGYHTYDVHLLQTDGLHDAVARFAQVDNEHSHEEGVTLVEPKESSAKFMLLVHALIEKDIEERSPSVMPDQVMFTDAHVSIPKGTYRRNSNEIWVLVPE